MDIFSLMVLGGGDREHLLRQGKGRPTQIPALTLCALGDVLSLVAPEHS